MFLQILNQIKVFKLIDTIIFKSENIFHDT